MVYTILVTRTFFPQSYGVNYDTRKLNISLPTTGSITKYDIHIINKIVFNQENWPLLNLDIRGLHSFSCTVNLSFAH